MSKTNPCCFFKSISYRTVRAFYEAVLRKMFACFPLDSQLLKDLRILDPGSRMEISPDTGRDNMFLYGKSVMSEGEFLNVFS